MIPYWFLFLFPAQASLFSLRRPWSPSVLVGLWIALSLFIGLRNEVGGDWFNYLPYVSRAEGVSFSEVLEYGDPGYNFLNWIFANSPWGIYGVNLVSASIFSGGLLYFCNSQPRPWLSLTLAIPYLVIVVAMGYTRQGVALGFLMSGLIALERGQLRSFILWITAAASFHSTALIMIAFVVPAVPGKSFQSRIFRLILLSLSGLFLAQTFLFGNIEQYQQGYIEASYQSQGATVRIIMNLLPALVLLFSRTSFCFSPQQSRLWIGLSLVAIGCVLILFAFPNNTTALDRISLYVIPLQLAIGSRIPDTFLFRLSPQFLNAILLIYSFLVQFVWLNFAINAYGWLPYKFVQLF